jgi:hypothetical protein
MRPLLSLINPRYFYRILDWQHKPYELAGSLAKVQGFDHYNNLIDLNSIFSTFPAGDPVDRTQTVTGPFAFSVQRPWKPPQTFMGFDHVIAQRVNNYIKTQHTLNLCWSGGIDSTCLVAGFLKNATHLDQLRVLYTPFSVYENREFFEYLEKNYPTLEMLDISGDVYLETVFDGIMINGHGGDEFTASLDESFFDVVGFDGLLKPWKSLVTDPVLQDFCTEYFALAQRPIDTVLEARWWFYAATKSQIFAPRDSVFATNATTSAFFNCQEFEDYMWHNIDQVISNNDYCSYKQFIKKYIYDFNHNDTHYALARKVSSPQFTWYTRKKVELLGQQWIAYLDDGNAVRTPNLPFFSEREFKKTYGGSLEYLFNYN